MFESDRRNRFIKLLGVVGTVAAVLCMIAAAVSGWVIWKWVRCMDTVQKSLPTIKKASALYIEKYEKKLDDDYCADDSDCIPF